MLWIHNETYQLGKRF